MVRQRPGLYSRWLLVIVVVVVVVVVIVVIVIIIIIVVIVVIVVIIPGEALLIGGLEGRGVGELAIEGLDEGGIETDGLLVLRDLCASKESQNDTHGYQPDNVGSHVFLLTCQY
jgi:hypothetical protein